MMAVLVLVDVMERRGNCGSGNWLIDAIVGCKVSWQKAWSGSECRDDCDGYRCHFFETFETSTM